MSLTTLIFLAANSLTMASCPPLPKSLADRDHVNRFDAACFQMIGDFGHRSRLPERGAENKLIALLGEVGCFATHNLRNLRALGFCHIDDNRTGSKRSHNRIRLTFSTLLR